jgi:molybdopterin molybdotransferase
MISVQEAQQRILSNFRPLETILVPLGDALGRVLTEPIHSEIDFPLFDNSAVDGFALRAEDISSAVAESPVTLQVVTDIPAGSVTGIHISSGQAARIMTGAPIPNGANAVVMVEDTDTSIQTVGAAAPDTVKVFKSIGKGQNIRWLGSDISRGQKIFPEGSVFRPQDIGMLAMLGIASVPVRRKPKVALISSGDELLPVDAPLVPGKIYDSNTYMLTALCQKAGCEVVSLGVAPDRLDAVQEILSQAVDANPDLIISSAGVSMGAFDYIKDAVETSGVLNFWKVNMRPGKPLVFGKYQNIPFFGLPGNPVSSYVGFLVFVLPALEALTGTGELRRKNQIKVWLGEGIESDGRESYLRAIVKFENGRNVAHLTGHQGSGNLYSLVQANALLVIPSGVKFCAPGSEVLAWMLET